MKIGIDSYCYHRYFGEVYEGQSTPEKKMTMDRFLSMAKQMGVDGVSLESCFFPSTDPAYLMELKKKLDDYGFDRVYAWGHPDGLERGKSEAAFRDMLDSIPRAKLIGADVMRITGSSLLFRHENHADQIKALAVQLKEAVVVAEKYGIKLAIENHIDFTADEILSLLKQVNSPCLGVNLDTGNFLRLLDDPIAGAEKLAPYVLATHVKDLKVNHEAVPTDWYFFSGVPVGFGVVDNDKLAEILFRHGYQGFLAVEIDYPHPDWEELEEEAVSISVRNLRKIGNKYKERKSL